MASAATSQKIASTHKILSFDHDPGGTSATIVTGSGSVVPMALYKQFGVIAMTSVSASSSGISLLEIVGCTSSAGANPTVVVAHTPSANADAVGNYVFAECTAAQVKEVGDAAGLTLTHVAARLTCTNSGDEAVVTYVLTEPKFPQLDLTTDNVA